MKHIVILGAGTGGLPCAYDLRSELGKSVDITVINAHEYFQFVPSNPWVSVGWRGREDVSFPLEKYLKTKRINFMAATVAKIDAQNNRLEFAGGGSVDYDYLVIATGPKLAFDEVEGLGPEGGYTQSVCTLNHAEHAYEAYQNLLDDPGHVVFGAVQGASCFGPSVELAFIMDADLRKRKLRHRVPMTYVTSEPYIGHLGVAGIGDSKGMLEHEFRMRQVQWITNAKVSRVEQGKMYVEGFNEHGEKVKDHELEFKYSMVIPAFKGVDCVAQVEGLCNPRGMVHVDDYQRNPEYPNIYAAGVCVAIPPVEQTPVPTGAPKTGYMIETMATAIAHNIKDELLGREPSHRATLSALCLADMGDTGAMFIAVPQLPPRNIQWMRKGTWVHLAKVGFEKYFLRKMKSGAGESVYEKYMLKTLGVERLQTGEG